MPSQAQKNYFAFQRGLNTEAPLINFPEGYSIDESNYELKIDGSRRRRPGLGIEDAGEPVSIPTYELGHQNRWFDWENVAGIPSINLMVAQVGYMLYIFDDTNPTSGAIRLADLDFRDFAVSDATDTQVAQWPLDAFFGRGHLFLCGKYTVPFYIEYDPDTELFVLNRIDVMERDFKGIEDGVGNSVTPETLTNDHSYNLKNRGWTDAYIASYQADQSAAPSKAMIPWLGLKRALTAGNYYDDDGIRSFSPAKLVAEIFQDASAPQGHFIVSPFEDNAFDSDSGIAITNWLIDEIGGPQTLTVYTDGDHGLAVSDTTYISNLVGYYSTTAGYPITPAFTVNQEVTVTAVPGLNIFQCTVTFPSGFPFVEWYDQFFSLGTIYTNDNPSGNVIDLRPKAGAFFAGRAWFSGIDTARLSGRIYFSQIIENDGQYGKCYQVADPTDERISDLVPSDGGVIVIPEASNIIKLVPYGSSLLVGASNGIWEIGPGQSGYFTADSYSVRKVSDSGVVSASSFVLADNTPVLWSVTDIFAIQANPQTGYLQENNLTQASINTFYNSIPLECRRNAQGVYDDLNKRIVWLYNSDSAADVSTYDSSLVFDTRLGAFTKNTFGITEDAYLTSLFVLKEAGETSKVKYVGIVDDELQICETNNTNDYLDFGVEEADAYIVGGYEALGDPAMCKFSPYVYVYSRKTETGYGPAPSYAAIRPSSTFMEARWDWSDASSAGKWGRAQQVYRHSRLYVPSDPSTDTFDNGVPLMVTKSQLRGTGRVLQLKFTAGEGKDSWLAGYKVQYNGVQY